jgi:hypothetical protein
MIRNLARFAKAVTEEGDSWESFLFRNTAPANQAGEWVDMSMGAGTPKYNAYVGGQLEATALVASGNNGIYAGQYGVKGKYINSVTLGTTPNLPACFILQDYLLFYPLVDGDNTDIQEMDNTQVLPRYTSGLGVQCMIVCTTPMAADANITVTYTNSDGVAGRISTSRLVFGSAVGRLMAGANTSLAVGRRTPYIPLASGDKGIRSIDNVQLASGAGGFFVMALVRPLMTMNYREAAVFSECNTPIHRGGIIPRVYNGAYLNFICNSSVAGTLTPLLAQIQFVNQ